MAPSGTARRDGIVRGGACEALLAAVVETSDDAIFTCDAFGRITSWCASAVRLFGRAEDDALGQTLDVLFSDHLRREVRAVVDRVMAGDQIRHFETEVLRADGMPMPVSLSLRSVADADRRRFAVVVIVRDVTEQVLAQAALAEVESRLQEGETLAHVGSWLWDLRTGVVQWSAEFHRIHGVDPLEFDGTLDSYVSAIHVGDRRRIRTAMEDSVASGRALEEEYRVVLDDRRDRVVRVRAHPTIGSAGTAVGLRGVGQDVTDQLPEVP